MKADDILGEAAIKTAAYLYTIKGECSPELYQAIATLRQLINEEFDPAKSLSSQFIYDIISPTIAQEANKARLDEAKWWSAKTVWLLKAAMDNDPAFDSHNKEMADRIAQLGGNDATKS